MTLQASKNFHSLQNSDAESLHAAITEFCYGHHLEIDYLEIMAPHGILLTGSYIAQANSMPLSFKLLPIFINDNLYYQCYVRDQYCGRTHNFADLFQHLRAATATRPKNAYIG